MGLLGNRNRVRNRRFDYEPRFYDPKKEEKLKQRMRIGMRVHSKRRRSPAGLIYFTILFFLAVYVYLNMG